MGRSPADNTCFEGIEFDRAGRRVAYWIYDEHPGGGLSWKMPTSRRVPAADVIHAFRVDRPGQYRGVPWAAPVIMTLWDLADYEDAELVRQKIAACFAVFYIGDDKRGLAQSVVAGASTVAGTPVETVEPGMIERLPSRDRRQIRHAAGGRDRLRGFRALRRPPRLHRLRRALRARRPAI
jgi:capsid protein